ncbi:unnamed protein product [Discosporangium mesarthrocarpum]
MEVEGEKGGGDDGSFSPPVVKGKGGLTEEEGASVTGADKTSVSALRENIARKGKNSYYYAHGRVMDTPSWDGRQAPRLLKTAGSPNVPTEKAKVGGRLVEHTVLSGLEVVKQASGKEATTLLPLVSSSHPYPLPPPACHG